METRPLGKTGLTVSRVGLGLAALGRPGAADSVSYEASR